MKNKKLFLGAFLVLVSIIFIAILIKPKSNKLVKVNPEFAKYISGYTSGQISKQSAIKISLTSEVLNKLDSSKVLPEDIFEFSPEIKGSSYWAGDNIIEFKPDENMPSDIFYLAKFKLDKLIKVEDDFKTFQFNFRIIKQDFQVSIIQQKTTDKKTLKLQKLIGLLETTDVEKAESVNKILEAFQNQKKLNIVWLPSSDNKIFQFEIDSIKRGDDASSVKIKWDGSSLNIDNKSELLVEIPSLSDFKLLDYKVINQPEQCLQLQFSDPLDQNQLLDGLITFSDLSAPKFLIDENIVKVFPNDRLRGNYTVNIFEGISNILGFKLKNSSTYSIDFEDLKPAVRLVSSGVILPSSTNGMYFPFEAVNLNAVDVSITKIYENNIKQFLQVNEIDGTYDLYRVGKAIVTKSIKLNEFGNTDLGKWNRFSIDINDIINAEPGALYRINLNIKKDYSLYKCNDESSTEDNTTTIDNDSESEGDGEYYEDDYYYYDNDYWKNRDNPCHEAYYSNNRSVSQNILASDIGLIAKQGNDNSIRVFVTDLLTTRPIKDAIIELYDYQQQLIKSLKTNSDGIADFGVVDEVFFVIAKNEKQRGYLKIQSGYSLSVSQFNVGGMAVNKGQKGFIYGERGVWRPGDSIYISFIHEDASKLPDNHPVIFELRNPKNQLVQKLTQQRNENGLYCFKTKTDAEAITGNYSVSISIGGNYYSQTLKIETIKPNRLKIKLDFGKDYLEANKNVTGKLTATWLHGGIAKNLKAQVDLFIKPASTYFEKYKDFNFTDPTNTFNTEENNIFSSDLDGNGETDIVHNFNPKYKASGKLTATFVTKVFENGGNFSIDQFSLPLNPFESYTGIKTPKLQKYSESMFSDTTNTIEFVVVDKDGKLIPESNTIDIDLYKVDWHWWWDNSESANYFNSTYNKPIKSGTITIKNGKASWDFRVNYPDWGRYLVLAKNRNSGHTTGKFVYIDWPGWRGRNNRQDPTSATMLSFSADKETYNVGETVNLTIPTGNKGRALVSIENGTKILQTNWIEATEGETKFSFKVTEEMAPNIYVHVSLLQPHAQTANDLPIRLYGLISLSVENPETHLIPVINMPDVLKSEEKVTIKISEKNKKDMSYTLAIVDEGLLDLTRFKTPQPWDYFYAKEALGVRTWDMYQWVIGAFGGKLERILSIGGSDEGDGKGSKKANRFKPMVKFIGPFFLKGGNTDTHVIEIPNYIGSVRTMVIAGHNKAYGSVEKTTPVKKPLMILGALPRVLGPSETVKLPINVFAMEKNIKSVNVSVKTNKLLKVVGEASKMVNFNEPGDELVEFDLLVNSEIGIAKIDIVATSGSEKATYSFEIDVRNPNPRVTNVLAQVIEVGKTMDFDFILPGVKGTNKAVIEVSSIPPLNLEKRLKYLIHYPYGCIEQTTSSVFPQLYLGNVLELNERSKADIESNIKAGILRLTKFQTSSGGFAYWPGGNDADQWGTSYGGHFLVEAKLKGYTVPDGLFKSWKKYQKTRANNWLDDGDYSRFIQAYRLYTLALEGSPEIGAMNRLREIKNLKNIVKWQLAAAYILAGKNKIAEELISNATTSVSEYTDMQYTYGSSIRDESIILECLGLLNKTKEGYTLLKSVSERLAGDYWYSTQSTAYSLIAISKFVNKSSTSTGVKFTYQLNSKANEAKSGTKPIYQVNLPVDFPGNGKLKVTNQNNGVLFARLILEGIPEVGETSDYESDLKLEVKYMLTDGTKIDPEQIQQGTDFIAEVKIIHTGYRTDYYQMALSQIFPSGWEIINTRMTETGDFTKSGTPIYQDFRDDRVYTFFHLNKFANKTFRVMLNASYAGRFYMPSVTSEAMYDHTIQARKHGMWVEVVK